jgi:acyl-CoA dehydrogenase
MNFDFSDEQKQLRDEVRRLLAARSSPRSVLDGVAPFDSTLWRSLAGMGLLGAAIPETYGGSGTGHLELCIVAEELGRALAAVPVSSSIYLAAECLMLAASETQKRRYLPKLASGDWIGCFAGAEAAGELGPGAAAVTASQGRLNGTKRPVADGDIADFAIVAARRETGEIGLFIVDLTAPGVERRRLQSIDPTRSQAEFRFANFAAEPLSADPAIVSRLVDRAAVLVAFEQVGGADRALEAARDYALERFAFGRPIGSFQAIKHMLADMYVSATLARSNAYWGAWALSTGSAALPEAAASARISATQAFQHCARNNIQVHGGAGFTWAVDCHLFYRRSQLLALTLGSQAQWGDRLIACLRAREAA